jgi:amino acid transporter
MNFAVVFAYISLAYILGAVVGWAYAGWQTGIEFTKVKRANPTINIQVNWASVFYQGLAWIALFASLCAETTCTNNDETPKG